MLQDVLNELKPDVSQAIRTRVKAMKCPDPDCRGPQRGGVYKHAARLLKHLQTCASASPYVKTPEVTPAPSKQRLVVTAPPADVGSPSKQVKQVVVPQASPVRRQAAAKLDMESESESEPEREADEFDDEDEDADDNGDGGDDDDGDGDEDDGDDDDGDDDNDEDDFTDEDEA